MITNTNNLGSVPTPANVAPRPSTSRAELPQALAANDSLSTEHAARLYAALAKTPEIRPEVVERAAALATDPDYPSVAIMGKIGRLLAQSKDLSLQEN